MIAGIFAAIQLILRLFGLWDQFLSWSDANRIKVAAENTAARNDAVDAAKGAKTPEEAFKDEEDIVKHLP